MQPPTGQVDRVYMLMPDGTICWEPTEADAETWREEQRDLICDPDDWD